MVRVGQAEEAADDVEQGIGTGGVFGGRGRAEGTPRVVEELVAEPRHGVGDRRSLRVGQFGPGDEEAVELAADCGLGAVGELAEQGPGIPVVSQGGEARRRLALDDRRARSSRWRRSARFRSTWARRSSTS